MTYVATIQETPKLADLSLMNPRLDAALRYAAACHEGQTRRASSVPYFEHVVAVGWILDRAGFGEDVVIAGLLHDVVEDTRATLEDIEERFGAVVAGLVDSCSEVKTDAQGIKRPWIDRKRDHLAALLEAPVEARAVMLADKLHNLISIEVDLGQGGPSGPSSTRNAIRSSGTTTRRSGRAAGATRVSNGSPPDVREVLAVVEAYALVISRCRDSGSGRAQGGPPGHRFFEFAGLPVDPARVRWLK